ncbi:MAG: GNAT family N-acetyltransferase [Rudaea sp.]
MDKDVRVRPATFRDITTIVDFNEAMALETESKTLSRSILEAGVRAVFEEPKRGFYRVAEILERVVGCVMITYEWSDWRNGDWWWLQSVYVHADFRRHGVFRAMYDDVESSARATSGVVGVRLYVEKSNHRAQSTYTSLGMHEAEYAMFAKTIDPRIAAN